MDEYDGVVKNVTVRRSELEIAVDLLLVARETHRITWLMGKTRINSSALRDLLDKLRKGGLVKRFLVLPKGAKLNPSNRKKNIFCYQSTPKGIALAKKIKKEHEKLIEVLNR